MCDVAKGSMMEYKEVKEKLDNYFESVNATSRRLVRDMAAIRDDTKDWDNLTPAEQADALWKRLVTPEQQQLYSSYPQAKTDVDYYPILRINGGEKIVIDDDGSNGHGKSFGYSWRDEHSAPFSWETQSQIDMCIEALQNLPSSEDTANKNEKPGQGCLRRKKKAPPAPTLLPRSTSIQKTDGATPTPPLPKTKVLPPQSTPEPHKDERRPLSKDSSLPRNLGPGSLPRKEVGGSLERRKAEVKRPAVEPPKPPVPKPSSSTTAIKDTGTTDLEDQPFQVDLQSPSQSTIPKTGFDFLDNW